jgi:hypothetical protein
MDAPASAKVVDASFAAGQCWLGLPGSVTSADAFQMHCTVNISNTTCCDAPAMSTVYRACCFAAMLAGWMRQSLPRLLTHPLLLASAGWACLAALRLHCRCTALQHEQNRLLQCGCNVNRRVRSLAKVVDAPVAVSPAIDSAIS